MKRIPMKVFQVNNDSIFVLMQAEFDLRSTMLDTFEKVFVHGNLIETRVIIIIYYRQ